uniref:NADH-ubiquinone oxidoreductase chain 5 n=1 Tax=Ptyodactylus guttatus TaxID=502503 RepID=A0A1Y1CC29_9SAUR|nr:NADH dehydrogenase subunit 5 [Ptyodactylus guttatus]BAX77907.1 NADH dehydrogenase subunit 5 [Ptyodactylus guttatus]
MATMLFHSSMAATLLVLIRPILLPGTTTPMIVSTMKLATMMSLIPTLIFTNSGVQSISSNLTWATMTFNLNLSFMFDLFTTLFLTVALFITWAILQFATWYMHTDPKQLKFSKFLLLFLVAMLTLISANNMLQLLLGWEGVGIMSFLLIGWWHGRNNASSSALQAIIYNRTGDIGLILAMAWTAMNLNTWEMHQMYSHQTLPMLPLLGLILAAMGKSAQFGLHPWLPAAMEGPTPVSALLHSSTMVVAGVFLLIRFHHLLQSNTLALTTCLCLGATTTVFAALCALTQNDMKKIIAYSTSSQLGLMMLTIGLNQPELAFMHITTHAFFKAMLFLCSGAIIHNLNDEQDIRKMGGIQKTLPITSACMTLGLLALTGTPFLAAFYTKDAIIESVNTSALNAWALATTLIATALTAAYSMRLVFYTLLNYPNYPSSTQPTESDPNQTHPIMRLALGSTVFGLIITSVVIPLSPPTMTMTPMTKLLALLTTLLGLLVALDLTTHPTMQPTAPSTFTTQLAFFNTLHHRALPTKTLKTAQLSLELADTAWYEIILPLAAKQTSTRMTTMITHYQKGLIKTYLTTSLLLLFSMLVLSNLYGTR